MSGRNQVSRRAVLAAGMGLAGAALLPRGARADERETLLDSLDGVVCAYVDRASGKVVAAKRFDAVNPELVSGPAALSPYLPPVANVYLGNADSLFRANVARYAIADIAARDRDLGMFSSLRGAYLPGEYTHHFLLTLADRELARAELGEWALARASAGQKQAALDLLHGIHAGYSGGLITGDTAKMAEAVRYYTGREVLVPRLFLGRAPEVGELALIAADGLRLAALDGVQIALAAGAVTGPVAVGPAAAQGISTAAQGASTGVSATAASVAGVGAAGSAAGASSAAGDGLDDGASGGTGGGNGGGAGAAGGSGAD